MPIFFIWDGPFRTDADVKIAAIAVYAVQVFLIAVINFIRSRWRRRPDNVGQHRR